VETHTYRDTNTLRETHTMRQTSTLRRRNCKSTVFQLKKKLNEQSQQNRNKLINTENKLVVTRGSE